MRRRLVRYGLVASNVAILGVVTFFVATGSRTSPTGTITLNDNAAANPVDGQTAYDIASNVARMADLPESTAIANQAQSAQATVAASVSDTSVVAKPQIVYTALKDRYDIQTYVAQPGDTIASIAQKFGITTNSVQWSNNLTGSTVSAGTKLVIPPMNGIVYTVQSGDTIQSLATKFSVQAAQIVAYNDAEIAGITTGEQILIPGGQVQSPTTENEYGGSTSSNYLAGSSFTPTYGNNGYDYGYCTWYVATQIAVPSNWGNAATWAYYAALSGWNVSSTPTVGAIAQTSAGYAGHVAIVTAVNGDIITISEMNATAGWGKVDSRTLPASSFQHYITH